MFLVCSHVGHDSLLRLYTDHHRGKPHLFREVLGIVHAVPEHSFVGSGDRVGRDDCTLFLEILQFDGSHRLILAEGSDESTLQEDFRNANTALVLAACVESVPIALGKKDLATKVCRHVPKLWSKRSKYLISWNFLFCVQVEKKSQVFVVISFVKWSVNWQTSCIYSVV